MVVGIQVFSGNGTKAKKAKVSRKAKNEEDLKNYLIDDQLTNEMIGNISMVEDGFLMVGFISAGRDPWNITVHGSVQEAEQEAARLFSDNGSGPAGALSAAETLANKVHGDMKAVGDMKNWLFLTRQKATRQTGFSIWMAWWGFEDYMKVST